MTHYKRHTRGLVARKIRKLMRTAGEAILLIVCFVFLPGLADTLDCYYNCNAVVAEVKGDEVLFEDSTGNLWECEEAGYQVGDKVSLMFYNNHTDNTRIDDEIKKVEKVI